MSRTKNIDSNARTKILSSGTRPVTPKHKRVITLTQQCHSDLRKFTAHQYQWIVAGDGVRNHHSQNVLLHLMYGLKTWEQKETLCHCLLMKPVRKEDCARNLFASLISAWNYQIDSAKCSSYLIRSTSRSQSRFLRLISDSIRRSMSRSRVAWRPSNVIVSLTSGTDVSDLPPPPATASTVPTTVDDADAVSCGVVLFERDDDGDDVDAAWRRSLLTSVMSTAVTAHVLYTYTRY